ncbi:MAG: hypothetical protein WCI11_21140 [Candidatus Methylumidiphilus sp.]
MRTLLYIATGVGLSMFIVLGMAALYITNEPIEIPINATIMILGLSLGWLCGTFMTPYNKTESEYVSSFTKAVSVFVSGYMVGKVDRVVEHILNPTFLISTVPAFRIMSFVASFIIALMLTYIFRQYYFEPK